MNTDILKYILMGILLLCGYFFLFQLVSKRTENRKSLPVVGIFLFVIYAIIGIPLMMIIDSMGNTGFVMLALLLLLSCFVLFMAFYGLIRNFRELNKGVLILFILYTLMVSYITIFSRSEGHSRAVMLRFDALREALRTNSLEPLNHALVNAAMFIPFGILFPLIRRGHLDRILYVGMLGLMMSTLIEVTQMVLTIGQCDVEDIVANTLGAMIGLIGYKIFMRFFGRMTEDDDEEEEEEEEEEEFE